MKLKSSPYRFRFGDGSFMSLEQLNIRIPTPDGSFLRLSVDVIKADVPLPIGLDVLDVQKLVADEVDNRLYSKRYGWSLPITRHHSHMYLVWDTFKSYFTRAELRRLHNHFWNPSPNKLYNLLKRTKPDDLDSNTLQVLQEISASCRTCVPNSAKGPTSSE